MLKTISILFMVAALSGCAGGIFPPPVKKQTQSITVAPAPVPVPHTDKEFIAACVTIVHREANPDNNPYGRSLFNAYMGSDGITHTYGSPQEGFLFEKCMSENGYQLTH